MREYGMNKSTEFTKRQIGVIFAKAKNGELKVEQWVMSDFYNLADYYGYDDNKSVENSERKILRILDNVFKNNTKEAQLLIDRYTESAFNDLSRKYQQRVNRDFVA